MHTLVEHVDRSSPPQVKPQCYDDKIHMTQFLYIQVWSDSSSESNPAWETTRMSTKEVLNLATPKSSQC